MHSLNLSKKQIDQEDLRTFNMPRTDIPIQLFYQLTCAFKLLNLDVYFLYGIITQFRKYQQ
jgi:hypothetical protein